MKLFNFKKKKEEEDKSIKIIHLDSVDSTNDYLRKYTPEEGEKITIVVADYQTAGRGQGTNTWESEAGKNLLFSILVHPVMVPIRQQFLLSMAGAIAACCYEIPQSIIERCIAILTNDLKEIQTNFWKLIETRNMC